MSGAITLKALDKINRKLKFLFRKNKFLTPDIVEIFAMCLFSHILTTRAQVGTKNLLKKNKK